MKTVFNNSELAHVWAQKVNYQINGSSMFTGKSDYKNDFFDTIYSYGYHFPISRFVEDFVIFNDSSYSNSTAKHQNYVRNAIRGQKVYFYTQISGKKVYSEIKALYKLLLKARKPEKYLSEILSLFNSYTTYWKEEGKEFDFYHEGIKPFTKEQKKEVAKIISSINSEELFNKAKESEKKAEQKKAKQAAKELKENLKKFEAHEINRFNSTYDYLRISEDKTEVQTSSGAAVSINDASILYRLIKAGKDIKGHKIGYYTVVSLNGVLHIGCHKINVENMHKVGKQVLNIVND